MALDSTVAGEGDSPPSKPFATTPDSQIRSSDNSRIFGRVVVLIVLGSVVTIGMISELIGDGLERSYVSLTPTQSQFAGIRFFVSRELPPRALVLFAIVAIVLVAFCAVSFEALAAFMSISPKRRILTSLRSNLDFLIAIPTQVRVTVLIPAHNEEYSLPQTLMALGKQTRQPDRVIVLADNCSDRTVAIAQEMGHEVFETVQNKSKKGGALNQVLSKLLPLLSDTDVILVMDADTTIGAKFIEVAAGRLEADPELSAVGGIFYGESGHGLIGQFQRNEYSRYSKQIRARHGRVFVLTGTATMFRSAALLDVAAARGIFIPGNPGQVYDTSALTEDNELTLALKSLGASMVSPQECTVVTELMPMWRNLWHQRQRWQRGALENLGAYGVTRATIRYWGQQLGLGYGTVAFNFAIWLMIFTALAMDQVVLFPFWTAVGSVFLVERVATAWNTGWRGRVLAVTLIPELLYEMFLQAVFINSLFNISIGRQATWGHIERLVEVV